MNQRIAILQVDGKKYMGTRFPNMALMQITAYHERQGDTVEWYQGNLFADQYDKIYASKIFSFSETPDLPKHAIIGGTGIDFVNQLPTEIDACTPSYSLYPDLTYHAGFSMKGCRMRCAFCCVPQKEGRPKMNSTIDNLLINPNGGNKLMLLDNDFFGIREWKENLLRIIELKLRVCFVQGVNLRIITEEQAELLAQAKYRSSKFDRSYISFAWDKYDDGKLIRRGIERCNKAGIPNNHMQLFVLIGFDSTHEQNLERVMQLKELGCFPYAMPYNKKDPYQKHFARWVNQRAVFNSCTWEEYKYNPS